MRLTVITIHKWTLLEDSFGYRLSTTTVFFGIWLMKPALIISESVGNLEAVKVNKYVEETTFFEI